jgi:hypothetical protein
MREQIALQPQYEASFSGATVHSVVLKAEMDYLQNVCERFKTSPHAFIGIRETREAPFRPVFKQRDMERYRTQNEKDITERMFALLKCVPRIGAIRPSEIPLYFHKWVWSYLHNTCGKPLYNERIEILFSYIA